MTQAFNLSQLANNLNTSGQLDATDGLTGATPVANGGTGRNTLTANNVILGNGTGTVNFVAPSTSGNVLVSNGTTWVSQAPAGGGVTSLNGQTGAITNTNFNAIGSYSTGSVLGNSYSAGATLAGTSLRARTTDANGPFNSLDNRYGDTNIGQTGTWRAMSTSSTGNFCGIIITATNLWVRIS
jgi:hypothetical protein